MIRGRDAEAWRRAAVRRMELWRGRYWKWRGAKAGARFGLGRQVRILWPEYLSAGDDVTIDDYGYLHCLSAGGVRIGSHSSVDRNVWLHCGGARNGQASGFEMGDHSYIGCNAVLGAGGGIRIGSNVLIGQSVNLHAESHVFGDPGRLIREQGTQARGVVIENDVWIGSRVTILDGVTIGQGAVVGAGAVVTRSVEPLAIVAGVPAHVIRYRGEDAE